MEHKPLDIKLPLQQTDDSAAIAYIHQGMVCEAFARSLAILMAADGGITSVINERGAILHHARNLAVHNFLSDINCKHAEWLWFVDTDMVFPPHTIRSLIAVAHQTDADIVVTPYSTAHGSSIIAKQPGMREMKGLKDDCAYECDAGGTGCMLISREFLTLMSEECADDHPWQFFGYGVIKNAQGANCLVGEDFMFCARAKAIGAKIVVWTGVKLGHVKQHVLTLPNNY